MGGTLGKIVGLILGVMILAGCAAPVTGVDTAIQEAQKAFAVMDNVVDEEKKGSDDYQEAKDKLDEALKLSESKSKQDKAKVAANQSLSASQRILTDFYRTTITPLARTARKQIEDITEQDPDNPLKEFLPKIDELLDYSTKLESGSEVIALNKVLEDLEEVVTIKHNTDENITATLDSDISFDPGKYELSDTGKQLLKDFFERIVAKQQEYLSQFSSGKRVTMKITVIGYTDQQGFQKGTALVKTLTEGMEGTVPEKSLDLRRFLNLRLSQFRANTIGEYIREVIEQADHRVVVEQNNIGRGEDVPPGITPSYKDSDSVSDPSRRICKVYSYVIVE
ncbi:lipoprotein, putative [Candidatus Moduliflexus flocculans]|uniref:Lipoprotein, putative n=1 Tax=Candidatus Moduliflexus flocculans TaxID=1499966 RepID=A0A0S6VY81_9BACT|nr:lipoprotein, putative [Candidatus Moduliflexus flocculans]